MNSDIKESIQKIINNQQADEKEFILQLKQAIYENEVQKNSEKKSRSLTELVSENLKYLQGNSNQENIIKSGFTDFDEAFGGFRLGELVVVGGRPAMGKTQLLINLALNISLTKPVLYFTLGLSEFLLTNRFISTLSAIPFNNILQHDFSSEQSDIIASIEPEFSNRKIFISESSSSYFFAFKGHCIKQIQENNIKVIFVDYLQLMTAPKHRNSRELEISFICRELKNLAKEHNVCIICSSQLSRAVESRGGARIPQLADLRESGAIEQDADKVIFIYRPAYYNIDVDEEGNNTDGVAEIHLSKNSSGRNGMVRLKVDEAFTSFRDFDFYRNEFSFQQDRLFEMDSPF